LLPVVARAGVRKSERFKLVKVLSRLRSREAFPAIPCCESLLKQAHGSGLFGGIADIMILADAVEERAAIASKDSKLVRLANHLGIKVVEVV
jgi:hypothetical protein